MRNINPYFSAVRLADRMIGDSLRTKASKDKRIAKGREYLDGTHRYRLIGNQEFLGEEVVMGGREAKARNQCLMEQFQAELREQIDNGAKFGETSCVLKRWVVSERNV